MSDTWVKFWCNRAMADRPTFISDFALNRLIILIDDAGSSRAALVAPALNAQSAEVNRILELSGGLTFVALSPERAASFLLHSMTRPSVGEKPASTSILMPQYTSVEAREGITTGISAADRAATIAILGAESPQPRALVKPGHIFPVETRDGGVLVKLAIPEGTVDLARLAGFTDAALFVDLLDEHGELMSADAAREFGAARGISVTSLTEIIAHRLEREPLVTRGAEAHLPTTLAGEVRAVVYRSRIHAVEHIALVKGDVRGDEPVLVRVQAESTATDVFGGSGPSTRLHLQNALRAIGDRTRGVFLYLRRPFIDDKSHNVQSLEIAEMAHGGAPAMMREYGVGAQILRDLGVTRIELLTTTPRSLAGLPSFGIHVVSQHSIPDLTTSTEHVV
jgi:3,4-dihydroxy 2-butanone 4-phosphate synthase/GTP cyclohydrolase II